MREFIECSAKQMKLLQSISTDAHHHEMCQELYRNDNGPNEKVQVRSQNGMRNENVSEFSAATLETRNNGNVFHMVESIVREEGNLTPMTLSQDTRKYFPPT